MVHIISYFIMMILIYWVQADVLYYKGKHRSFSIHSNEIGLELNVKKTKYMVMSRDQHAVQNHNIYIYIYIYIGNKSFESVKHFKYLGTSLSNQNSIHEEIKCRLQSGTHHHHHHRLYSPGWALAPSSRCRQHHLSWASACQFLQPSFPVSSSTPSIHLDFSWPHPQ